MEKHDYVVLSLVILFGILIVLLFTGASEAKYDAYGQAIKAVACVETDDGINFFLRGTTYISNDKRTTFQDFCRDYDSAVLKEYYCEKGKIVSMDAICEYGCTYGACKKLNP